MLPETITVKPLDGSAVFCEADGCEKPALYLFQAGASTRSTKEQGDDDGYLLYSAYCEVHAEKVAERAGLVLPLAKVARSQA